MRYRHIIGKILDKTGLSVSHDRLIGISMERSLTRSFRLISTSLTHSINSLKLHNISGFPEASYKPCDGGQTFPALQHLDLGISADILFQKRRHWTRSSISYFKHLRTLRIEWETDCEDHFYIDELFIAYGDNSNVTKFPHLKSLTLVKFWLSHHAFLAIAASHASTLKELELIQVTLDSSCWPKSWSEMDALCKNALPSLTYLRLAQLISYTADSPPETRVEVPEAATTYEWTKGIHGATPMTGNWCATRKEEKTEAQGSLP